MRQGALETLEPNNETSSMRATQYADRLHDLEGRLTAMKHTLHKAYMPSTAVAEVARVLRASAHELGVIADDLDEAQTEAANAERQELSA